MADKKAPAKPAAKAAAKVSAKPTMTVDAYLASLTPAQRTEIEKARAFVNDHIAKGYVELMNWGVINWAIPLEVFPDTYNQQPLCYVALGAKKNYNAFYLMSADDGSDAAKLLAAAFAKAGKKLDMGKSCLPWKKLDDLDLQSVGKIIAMAKPKDYIAQYQRSRAK